MVTYLFTAASSGLSLLSSSTISSTLLNMIGSCFGCLNVWGVSQVATVRVALTWSSSNSCVCPCSMCHTLSPTMQLASAVPEYEPAQLEMNAMMSRGLAGHLNSSDMSHKSQNT